MLREAATRGPSALADILTLIYKTARYDTRTWYQQRNSALGN